MQDTYVGIIQALNKGLKAEGMTDQEKRLGELYRQKLGACGQYSYALNPGQNHAANMSAEQNEWDFWKAHEQELTKILKAGGFVFQAKE